jgi:sugar lactone lactonase YvrE
MSLAWLKIDVLLGSVGKLAAASLLLTTLGITGCGDDPVKAGVAKGCTLNSDCNGGLVCSFGLCHKECEQTTDCPANQRCVQSDTSNVCQLTEESQCHFNTDCAEPLVCAIDLQCRNQCQGDKDCLAGQKCADNVCAEPKEVSEDGGLKGAVGAGGEGGAGGTTTPGNGGAGGDQTMSQAGTPGVLTCVPGGECVPADQPCKVGTIACQDNQEVCEAAADAEDGAECGTDQVCSAGACVACKVGDTCQDPNDPDNACLTGTVTCATGPDCDVADVAAGSGCGTDQVCDGGGSCVACKVDEACDPAGQACKNGKMKCSSGPVCAPTTNKDAGTTCAVDKVCDSSAACVACVQNGVCEPGGNECHVGVMDCTNGPNCSDTNVSSPDGISCTGLAAYNFCADGTCAACQNGNACIPTNPCHKGTLNCSTTPPTCNDSASNADDGIACGDNKSCISGACLTNDRTLTITSGAVADVAIDAPFANVTVHLVDKDNKPVLGAAVTVLPSAGAYAVASAGTNASGNAQISGRVGRAIGTYTFTVSAPGATSIEFSVNAIATAAKNIFTLVNVNYLDGYATPGPGTVSKLYYQARAVTAAADGTLYFSDYGCTVYQLTPAGALTRIAGSGTGSCGGASDDSGLATSLLLGYYIDSLALDEAHGFLYIADQYNGLVRQLSLADGQMLTYAGKTGATNAKPWGDNGPADSAHVSPTSVAVAANGDLYIGDQSSGSIRKVDYNTNIITTPFKGGASYGGGCVTDGPLTLYTCGGFGDPCSVAWDQAGKMFISGNMCGDGNYSFHGVARVENDSSLSLVAGSYPNGAVSPAEGGAATSASFTNSPYLAFDKAGNLFLSTYGDHRVRRIDSVTTKITTVAGTGTGGVASGDYAIGSAAVIKNPASVAFDDAGNLYFADSGNRAIRTVYGIGSSSAGSAKLATTLGNGQSVKRNAAFDALLVKLTDANNVGISGVNLRWKRLETGSGLGANGATATTAKTNASGGASMTGRVGLATGAYHFEASYSDIHGTPVTGSPQSFTVTAVDPDAGTIFPIVNYVHTSGLGGYPGPGSFAKLQSFAGGVTAASDGTIYTTDQCAVYAVTPAGELSVYAGTPGSCGFSGDSSPAVGAKLYYPYGLALDEAKSVLYIADYYNSRIRMVDMITGNIDTLAGGGAVNTAPYGDGGQAIDANIGNPQSVAVAPDGKVYIPDGSHYYIRQVDPTTGIIKKWFTPSYTGAGGAGCADGTASLYYPDGRSAIRFKANGDAYLSGYICEGITTNTPYGIVLRAANGTFTRVAGVYSNGSETENILATSTTIPDLTDIEIDGNGDLVLAMYSTDRLRKIDMVSGKITTIGGDGTAGYALPTDVSADPGAYVAATAARLYNPYKLGLWPGGHVLIADYYNYSTRMIW